MVRDRFLQVELPLVVYLEWGLWVRYKIAADT